MNTQTDIKSIDLVIDDITEAIQGKDKLTLHNASYETGLLGYSLYYAYLAKFKNDKKYYAKAEEYFNRAIQALDINNFQRVYDTDSIDGHLSHIGRFVSFVLEHKLLLVDADDYLNTLDGILFELMKTKVSIKDFDSLSGAMASGYYFLSRMKDGQNVTKELEFLVHSLENFAERDADGDYYWISPSLYDRVYLGISHGSCLMISFLSQVHSFNIQTEACERILRKAVSFVRKQYRKTQYKGLFPNMMGEEPEPMQFALCYGDIGTGFALLRASKVLKDPALSTLTDLILDDCLTRSKEDNLTLDAGIFYGASGLVIAFEKITKLTGEEKFGDRQQYWYDKIVEYKIHDNPFAGFKSRLDAADPLWNVAYGWGILGIGITLMAYADNDLPAIDKLTFIA